MAYRFEQNPAVPSETQLANTFIDAMARVYLWMAGGLLTTAIVATVIAQSDGIADAVLGRPIIFIGLFIVQIGLVIGISAGINKMSPATALGLFFLYSGLMGVTLSMVFLVYELGTIGLAFGVTTALFTAMSIIGLTTKKDLTSWGPILMASLFGLIIASVANAFLRSSAMEWIVSFAGVAIFMALTVYDSKKIKTMTFQALSNGDAQAVSRVGVLGALSLYLDFINLFLVLLRILGGRR